MLEGRTAGPTALTKRQNLKSLRGFTSPHPLAICHCKKEREKYTLKKGKKGLWTSERVIFIWNMTGTFYLRKRKENYISYKTGFIKRFELVIAVTQEQGLNSDHSCLNAALKLSWRSWVLLVKKRAHDLSVANDREDFAFIKLNTLAQGLHAYQSLLSRESYSGICGDPTCESQPNPDTGKCP